MGTSIKFCKESDIEFLVGIIDEQLDETNQKGENDLEVKIKILEKEVDTLKAIVDLKDIEIKALSDNLKKIKDQHNRKVLDKFLDDVANNTPNDKQFK